MEGLKHDIALRLVKVSNAVLATLPFSVAWFFYYAGRTWSPFYFKGDWAVIGLFLFLYAVFGKVYDAFLVSLNQMFESVYSQSLAALFSDSVLYIVIWLLTKRLPSPIPLSVVFLCQAVLAAVWFRFANRWYFSVFPPKKSAVIYDMRNGLERLVEEYGLAKKFDIRLTLGAEECLRGISVLDGMDTVFLSGIHSHDRNIILKYCIEKGIEVYVIPRIGDTIMSGAKQMHMFHLPILRAGRYSPSPAYLAAKRLVDMAVSLVALVVLFPAWLVVAAAVKAEDGGDIFYRQCRLTKDGKEFDVLKFRSMKMDAEGDGVARLSSGENDGRLTKVGRIIRKVRLDELPQLLCILKGDMSLVGPRPERPEIAMLYEKEMPEFRLRLQAKAGLTGYAQVYGKYNTTPYDKLQMDLMYIAHPGMAEDFRIMLATVKILFLPESTEGIEDGAVTAMEEAVTEERKQGKVSIITPCYNGEKYIGETIESVLAQTYDDWEMIIVDDGSTDHSAETIKKYCRKDARIQYISQENAGSSAARNHAILHAKGQYIALLDADDIWMPRFLEKQIAFMKEKRTVCVCCSYGRIDENSKKILRPVKAKKVITIRDMMVMNRIGCLSGLYDSSKYGKVYLDERLKSIRDDYAYWLEIVKFEGKAYGNSEVLAYYRVLPGSTTGNKKQLVVKQYAFYRNYLKLGPVRCWINVLRWGISGAIKFLR